MAALLRRYLADQVRTDLERKMVFVSGPRQVGKTTLARDLLPDPAGYLSRDIPDHRDAILRGRLPNVRMLVFDELHKFRGWRGFLKGLYDRQDGTRILVTGSGRLDYYRHGGDSLQGRYHLLRLHPLSIAELGVDDAAGLRRLLDLGGFPEPWVGDSLEAARRWSREYRMRLAEAEIRDLEGVADVSAIELLAVRLTDLVGSPLSVNALRENLQVSHGAVSPRAALCHLPGQAVRRTAAPRRQEGAEALPLRLDQRDRHRRLPDPGRHLRAAGDSVPPELRVATNVEIRVGSSHAVLPSSSRWKTKPDGPTSSGEPCHFCPHRMVR